jgi:hypothetical protein
MLALSRLQPGVSEGQPLFGRIDPELERLQRLRAPYNWVSTWAAAWAPWYVFLWAVSLVAYRRVRQAAPQDLRFFLVGLPLLGILTIPASYILIERLKWIAGPQVQPARGLVFVTVIAAFLAAVAGVRAAAGRRLVESGLWFALVYFIPAGVSWTGVLIAIPLAAVAVFACASRAAWAVAVLAPFFVMPGPNHPEPPPELREVAQWARASTPADSMFLFPDAGKSLDPGIFRARALRSVYVDWKGGGQVNFLRRFAREWWDRWQRTGAGRFKIWHLPAYRRWGIDYFVLKHANRLPDRTPVFENSRYAVYSTW